MKTTIHPNTLTAPNAGVLFSNAELNSGTKYLFRNILIQYLNYLENLLVIHSFLLILQTTLMHTVLTLAPIIHSVLETSA